jgi:hypothetical protein
MLWAALNSSVYGALKALPSIWVAIIFCICA